MGDRLQAGKPSPYVTSHLGGHSITQRDYPGSYTDCTRPSSLEKNPKGAAIAFLSSIAKAISQVSQVESQEL